MSVTIYLFSFLFNFIACYNFQFEMGFERDPGMIYDIVKSAYIEGSNYGLEPEILLALSFLESRWNPDAGFEDARDSSGLYQQLPQYSSSWNDDCWNENDRVSRNCDDLEEHELRNLWYATRVAARHLSTLVSQEDDLMMALERYYRGNLYDENNTTYAESVMRYKRQIFD
jgi:hypothetical protein